MRTINSTKRQVTATRLQKRAGRLAGRVEGAHRNERQKGRLRRNQVEKPGKLLSRAVRKAGHNVVVAAASERRVNVSYQSAIKNFEMGVRAFQKQNYERAAEIFQKLVNIDAREVAERAKLHLRLCQQRTGRFASQPKSADEFYALGVACLNARDFSQAIENLGRADKLKPNQDHVHYALAAGHALRGDSDAAFAHLERAFTLRPENRIHARRDQDFQGLAADPRFRRLIHPAGV